MLPGLRNGLVLALPEVVQAVITISTTTDAEADVMTRLMQQAPPGTAYQIYLLGRQVLTGGTRPVLTVRPAVLPAPAGEPPVTWEDGTLPDPAARPGSSSFLPAPGAVDMPEPALYDVMFPVRPRVIVAFTTGEIELAARVAFWQQPGDDCEVPAQDLVMTWMDDLVKPGSRMIRVSGDVIPPAASPADDPASGRHAGSGPGGSPAEDSTGEAG